MPQHQVAPRPMKSIKIRYVLRHPLVTIGIPTVVFLNSLALGWSLTKMHQIASIYHLITFLSTSCFNFLGNKNTPETIRNNFIQPSDIHRTDHRCNILTLEFDDCRQTCRLGSFSSKKARTQVGLFPLPRIPVTTRIITCLAGNPFDCYRERGQPKL